MGAPPRAPHFLEGLPPPVLGLRPAPELVAARVRAIRWHAEPEQARPRGRPPERAQERPPPSPAAPASPRPPMFSGATPPSPLGADATAPTAPTFAPAFEALEAAPMPASAPAVATRGPARTAPAPEAGPELRREASSPSTRVDAAPVAAAEAPGPSRPAAQSEPALARVEAAIVALRAQGERLAEQARSDALEIGFMVARRILERDVSTDLESLFAMIRSAIRRAGESRRTLVRLSPMDAARVRASGEATLTLGPVEILADEELGTGDVVVETDDSTVDGRLGTRLGELRRDLSSTLSGE